MHNGRLRTGFVGVPALVKTVETASHPFFRHFFYIRSQRSPALRRSFDQQSIPLTVRDSGQSHTDKQNPSNQHVRSLKHTHYTPYDHCAGHIPYSIPCSNKQPNHHTLYITCPPARTPLLVCKSSLPHAPLPYAGHAALNACNITFHQAHRTLADAAGR